MAQMGGMQGGMGGMGGMPGMGGMGGMPGMGGMMGGDVSILFSCNIDIYLDLFWSSQNLSTINERKAQQNRCRQICFVHMFIHSFSGTNMISPLNLMSSQFCYG